ncbi:MAG: tol-pal system protein YbgF [Acidiferrobacteraceae bacterium]
MRVQRLSALVLLLAVWPVTAVQAAMQLADSGAGPPIISLSTDGSVTSGTTASTRSGAMLDLLQQIQDLKQRVESLQNQIELQNHELQQLKREQRDFFSDVDSQLSRLKQGQPEATPAAPPVAVASSGSSPVLAHSAKAQKDYDHAFDLLRAGHYRAAITAFQGFLKIHGSSQLADNAHYWIAETYYVLGQYRHALPEFHTVVHRYATSPKVPDSLFKMGYIENRLGLPGKARQTWETLVRRYPNSSAALLAKKHLHP